MGRIAVGTSLAKEVRFLISELSVSQKQKRLVRLEGSLSNIVEIELYLTESCSTEGYGLIDTVEKRDKKE